MTERDYREKLKNQLIKYRTSLNLSRDVTFGIEIEYENVPNELITQKLIELEAQESSFYDWANKEEIDITVKKSSNSNIVMNGEVVSPVLIDNLRAWKNLKKVLDILNQCGATVTNKCGAHVNIGAHILGYNPIYWRNFLLLWLLYEEEIYIFSTGEFSIVRTRNDHFIDRQSQKLRKNLFRIMESVILEKDIYSYLRSASDELQYKMGDFSLYNFNSSNFNVDNRIEFRIPNGTLKEEIWQNYINFFSKFMLACKKELDVEKTIYKIAVGDHNSIELANLIFDSEVDIDNFLIQSLKTNKVYKKELMPHIECY